MTGAGWSAMSAGARAAVIGLGGAATLVAGTLVWQGTRPVPTVVPEAAPPVTAPVLKPEAAPAPEAEVPAVAETTVAEPAVAEPVVVEAAVVAPQPARITTWAVDAQGMAVISGEAMALAEVVVSLDGVELARGPVTRGGEFALMAQLSPSDQPRILTLETVLADGQRLASDARIAIGPVAGPAVQIAAGIDVVETATPPEVTAAAAVATDQDTPEIAAPPATLLISAEGAVVPMPLAQGGGDSAPRVAISTISYTPEGQLVIGGQAPEGTALRLYVDNGMLADLHADAEGRWQHVEAGIAPGLHLLRADLLADDGTVMAREELPFRREGLADLARASGRVPDAAPAADPGPVAQPAPALDAPAEATAPVESPRAEALAAAQGTAPALAVPALEPPHVMPPLTITVQPGHTLWSIARGELGAGVLYVQVFDANRQAIRDPDLIYPGQVFTIPGR